MASRFDEGDARTVSVARDFSRFPGPRFARQGKHSGEAFRALLVDLLLKHGHLTIDLDGTTGMGSSFIDEAIGGLIAKEGFERATLLDRLSFVSKLDESYLVEVKDSLDKAKPTR